MYMPKLGAVHNLGLILFKSDLVADAQHLVRRLMGRHRVCLRIPTSHGFLEIRFSNGIRAPGTRYLWKASAPLLSLEATCLEWIGALALVTYLGSPAYS